MHRIDHDSADPTGANGSPGFTDGVPGSDAATVITAGWLNELQESVVTALLGAGAHKGQFEQLHEHLIARSIVRDLLHPHRHDSQSGVFSGGVYGVAHSPGGSRLFACGDSATGKIFSSDDAGVTWTERHDNAGNAYHSIARQPGGGNVVAAGIDDVADSSDGVTWSTDTGLSGDYVFYEPLNDVFVVVDEPEINTSDATTISWSLLQTFPTTVLEGGAASDSASIVVGHGGEILRRTGSGTFSSVSTPTTEILYAAAYVDRWGDNGAFIAVGANGVVLVSEDDGATWVLVSSGSNGDFHGITVLYDSIVVAVAEHNAFTPTLLVMTEPATVLPFRGWTKTASGGGRLRLSFGEVNKVPVLLYNHEGDIARAVGL